MEIGTKLKEARVAQDLSLESVQETTKIQKRYLVAIEEGNFQILPGKFYARAFIKEYATAVGLDPGELLDEYQDEVPKTEEENTEQYTRIQRSRRDTNSSRGPAIFSFFPTIIVIILIIGIIFAAYYFYSKSSSGDTSEPVDTNDDNEIIYNPGENENQDNQKPDDGADNADGTDSASKDENQTDATKEEENPEKTEPTLELVEEGSGPSPESTFDLNNAGDEVIIKLESDSNSYLGLTNGEEKEYYAGPFTADDSPKEIDVSGDERIYFNVGSAPGLQITIDGVELKYPVDPAEKVHQKIWININQEQ
ncbi:helix-turn-helix domain-containing protein [Virgibacillus phasianinus]|uniref:Helix-turn-helix domain-containing protein n=1 Tax=Virgibacillus phasianinus TaxID=2017483 RepID=A0A220U656_9BACI|nr:helix-turn-helix domain-containing protein [Virgibacillus phasianinus]ASK63462.1 helix-turn-helix domain-containing protein [Virgibacillus phasianinus]